jgi:hypothetical protein
VDDVHDLDQKHGSKGLPQNGITGLLMIHLSFLSQPVCEVAAHTNQCKGTDIYFSGTKVWLAYLSQY